MKRRRYNDPLGVTDSPEVTTDSSRIDEFNAELGRRLDYLMATYRFANESGNTKKDYNASPDRLKIAVGPSRKRGAPETRLNPLLELEINLVAHKLAALRSGEDLGLEHQPFVDHAAESIARTGKKIRGTPGQQALRRVVEGLMAIFVESTKTPVIGPRDKDKEYNPHLAGSGGKFIRMIVDRLEPNVPDAKLAYWIREIRKKIHRQADALPGHLPGIRHHGRSHDRGANLHAIIQGRARDGDQADLLSLSVYAAAYK